MVRQSLTGRGAKGTMTGIVKRSPLLTVADVEVGSFLHKQLSHRKLAGLDRPAGRMVTGPTVATGRAMAM